uniref:Uncharacterized protein n=1 Tax=Arundo donax TaxID=35708 RepID=A0A0A9HX18_ARUDO
MQMIRFSYFNGVCHEVNYKVLLALHLFLNLRCCICCCLLSLSYCCSF